MVSLGNNESGRSGGYFFDGVDTSMRSNDSEELIQNTSIVTELEPPYRRIGATWLIVLQILLIVVLEVISFIDPLVCHQHTNCPLSGYEVTIYAHVTLWFILLAFDRYLNYLHNRSRMAGYLEFYRSTNGVRRAPLFINSFANVALLAISTVILIYCTPGYNCGLISRNNVLQILVSLEVVAILISLLVYLVKTIRFNRLCAIPDVQRDELATSFTHHRSLSAEVGFRDDDYLDQVLEKQADMIRYLKQHTAHLAKRVLTLTAELNGRQQATTS